MPVVTSVYQMAAYQVCTNPASECLVDQHPSQEFPVVGTVVGSCLIPLAVPVPERHQTPFIGRIVMLQSAIAVQT